MIKIQNTVNEILKTSVRTLSKMKFKDKLDFENATKKLTEDIRSNIVSVNLKNTYFSEDKSVQPYQNWKVEFEIIFNLNDPFVDVNVYKSGSVYIFPSKEFYNKITKYCEQKFGAIPEWNDSKTTGTITGKARDY